MFLVRFGVGIHSDPGTAEVLSKSRGTPDLRVPESSCDLGIAAGR